MKRSKHRRPSKQKGDKKEAFFPPATDHQKQGQVSGGFTPAELEIDPVNSPAEKEADAAADKVINHPRKQDTLAKTIQRKKIQRQSMEEDKAAKLIQKQEEEDKAAKLIQKQEEEDKAAKLIQKQEEEDKAAKLIQKQEEEDKAAKLIQKQEEEDKAAKLIQRKDDNGEAESSEQELDRMIRQTKGQGMALPDELRAEMESEFEADLSKVRIHTDPKAVEMTEMIGAQAFTHGYDIYFNEGRYDPDSKAGKELLAHELAHVVQQKGSGK